MFLTIMKNKRIFVYLNMLTEKKVRLELDLEAILLNENLEYSVFEKKLNKTLTRLNKIDYKIKLINNYVILNTEENE